MSVSNFFQRSSDEQPIVDRNGLLARYKHVRRVSRNLNSRLVQRLSKDVLFEGARKLGILKGNTLVFETEDESSVLMDYCIYDVRRDGLNALEEYLIECSPESESDEMTCLRAMQRAIYSFFVVETIEHGFGVTLRDMLTDEIHLVVDMGMGMSADPGMVFATRLLFHNDFTMTGGAGLPVAVVSLEHRDDVTKRLLTAIKRDKDGNFDPAPLIRSCLKNGSSSRIRYLEPTGEVVGPEHPPTNERGQVEVGRYDPCPCGSGKKFKFCCLNRR